MRTRFALTVLVGALATFVAGAGLTRTEAAGVSGYVPLHESPEIERDIERVMVLGGVPVLVRPIPVALVHRALQRACPLDESLCRRVRAYLAQFGATVAVTDARAELAASSRTDVPLPNQHGLKSNAKWRVLGQGYYRPDPYVQLSVGGIVQTGDSTPTGTMLSIGIPEAQLDFGYRDIWLSPMTDSSMLLSTEAPTLPSVTFSNPLPLTRLGFQYQFSLARMGYSSRIAYDGGYTAGNPMLGSMHLGIEPVPGWAVSVNRIFQFGGGARTASLSDIVKGYFGPGTASSAPCTSPGSLLGGPSPTGAATCFSRFANQAVSISSAFTTPGPTPMEVYVSYAGRDSFHGERYRFHETDLSAGVHFPDIAHYFDLTIEGSEWQNFWYTDYIWQDGLTNDGYVIGNWGADWRNPIPGSVAAPGARSFMAQLGWTTQGGNEFNVRLRTLQNAAYYGGEYRPADMLSFEWSQSRGPLTRGLTIDGGRDEFGKGFIRLAGFLSFDGDDTGLAPPPAPSSGSGSGSKPKSPRTEVFIDVGASSTHLGLDLLGFTAAEEHAPLAYHVYGSPHLGIGVRRAVSAHNDLGMRLEYDDLNGPLVGIRFLDYRYRFGKHAAVGGFVGFARYSGPTPAQGYYGGFGAQWRNILPHWDLSLDWRYFDRLQRDKLLPTDPQNGDPAEAYTGTGESLYMSYWFL